MNNATHLMNTSLTRPLRMLVCDGHLFQANLLRRLGLSLILLCAALLARPCAATPGEWEYTGSLNTARVNSTATLLPNGTVLVSGGNINNSGNATATAEIYNPATGRWTFTGSMAEFLESNSQVNVEFEGSKGTRYVQILRPQGGTGRWTYLAIVREPNARWYLCSTPCKDWEPARSKPLSDHCPFCKSGVIVEF